MTRSGTTTEVLDALDASAAPAGSRSPRCTDSRRAVADEVLVLDFADEKSVVQTRFPTTMLRARAGRVRGGRRRPAAGGRDALAAPLPVDPEGIDHVVYLGTGWTLGLAQEAALKIRETAQALSESYPALDYRHGPVAVGRRSAPGLDIRRAPRGPAGRRAATGATVLHRDLDPLAQLVLAQRLAVALADTAASTPTAPVT